MTDIETHPATGFDSAEHQARLKELYRDFEAAGMTVRYVEARDGHNWENWRDRLREGLSWIFPGPQKFFYE